MTTALLETQGISKRFGGVEAVREVDFSLPAHEIRAVIGPNGAGKTTLVGTISGRLRPTSGRVLFKGRDITGRRSWQRVADGIVYTFQITSVFQNLTCRDNVALAAQRPLMTGLASRLRLDPGRLQGQVAATLARVGLADQADRVASTLARNASRSRWSRLARPVISGRWTANATLSWQVRFWNTLVIWKV